MGDDDDNEPRETRTDRYLSHYEEELLALVKKIEQERERERKAKERLKFQRRRFDDSIAHIISHSYKIKDLRAELGRKNERLGRNVQRLRAIAWTLQRDHLVENMCTIAVDLKRAEYLISRGTQRIFAVSNIINTTAQQDVKITRSVIRKLNTKAECLEEKLLCLKRKSGGHFTKNVLVSTYEGALQVILAAMTGLLEKSIAQVTEQEHGDRLRANALEHEAREIRKQAERFRTERDEFLRKKLRISFSNTRLKICYVNFGAF